MADKTVRQQITEMLEEAILSDPKAPGTWYFTLGVYGKLRWVVCAAWMDYNNEDKWELYAKIAYQTTNNIMQCDYDIDWLMPYDPVSGEVYDTEFMVVSSNGEEVDKDNVDWILREWDYIKKTFIDTEEEAV